MLITSSISGWGCSTLVPWTLELCQVCIVFLLWHICVRPSLFSSTWPEMKYRIGGKTPYSPLLYTFFAPFTDVLMIFFFFFTNLIKNFLCKASKFWYYICRHQNPLEMTASTCLRKIHRQILLSTRWSDWLIDGLDR